MPAAPGTVRLYDANSLDGAQYVGRWEVNIPSFSAPGDGNINEFDFAVPIPGVDPAVYTAGFVIGNDADGDPTRFTGGVDVDSAAPPGWVTYNYTGPFWGTIDAFTLDGVYGQFSLGFPITIDPASDPDWYLPPPGSPSFTSISPSPAYRSTTVTLTGTDLSGVTALYVRPDGGGGLSYTLDDFTVVDDETLTATVADVLGATHVLYDSAAGSSLVAGLTLEIVAAPAPTLVPYEIASFDPGWTESSAVLQAGAALIDATHSVAWWLKGGTLDHLRNIATVIDHTDPAAPTFGADLATEAATAGVGGEIRPVPDSQLLLLEGPDNFTISCLTWDATSLALTTEADYGLPSVDPDDATNRLAEMATVVPLTDSRAFILMESYGAFGDTPPVTRNCVWFLVNLTSTGIGTTIAHGKFPVGTDAFVVVSALRIDDTRIVVALNDTDDSAVIIEDTGSGATVGTPLTHVDGPIGTAADGTFYYSSAHSGGVVHLTTSGTSLVRNVLGGSTTEALAVAPFDDDNLISLTLSDGAAVVNRAFGTIGSFATDIPIPDVAANSPRLHLDVATVGSRLVYIADWEGEINAEYPLLHLISARSPGGWGVGMIRMGPN